MNTENGFGSQANGQLLSLICKYLSERSPQPMVAVEGESFTTNYVNPAFAQLVGKKRRDLIGLPFAEAVPEDLGNGCQALLARVFHTGQPEKLPEQEHRHARPSAVYWSYFMWAILGADEQPLGVMIQITDSTETARFRQQAVEINESLIIAASKQHELASIAKSLSAKLQSAIEMRDRFIAVMSHELRNPLATLSSGLELLKLANGEPNTVELARDMMARQLKQMVRLVDDMLDISRITTGKLELQKERVDLASIVRNAVEVSRTMIDERSQNLTVTLPPGPIFLDADSVRLTQVFLNLLNNSAKYSEEGGEIQLSALIDKREIVVSVRDTGIGIPTEKLPSIFDPFVQVDDSWEKRQGGMGIGLSLVKEFVELHGGHVEARSAGAGMGSEFIVRLPLAEETSVMPIATPGQSRPPRKRILVVDDNRDAAHLLSMVLRSLGHEVVTAHDGETGLTAAAKHQPDLILMDLGMPKMDGYEVCRRIRAEPWGDVPFIVALTGWGSADDLQRTLNAGFDRHLVKPVGADAISQIIKEIES